MTTQFEDVQGSFRPYNNYNWKVDTLSFPMLPLTPCCFVVNMAIYKTYQTKPGNIKPYFTIQIGRFPWQPWSWILHIHFRNIQTDIKTSLHNGSQCILCTIAFSEHSQVLYIAICILKCWSSCHDNTSWGWSGWFSSIQQI